MTTKEYAEYLIRQFKPFALTYNTKIDLTGEKLQFINAKKCALISINQLIISTETKLYYQEVKKEIEKL